MLKKGRTFYCEFAKKDITVYLSENPEIEICPEILQCFNVHCSFLAAWVKYLDQPAVSFFDLASILKR